MKVRLLQIPREVTERRVPGEGEVQFFALASLEIGLRVCRGVRPHAPTATVTLKNFVIPELVGVRSGVKQWSDYVDYWAVDWNFQPEVFAPGWVAYRSRRDHALALTSAPHVYEKPGSYRVLIKVLDVFGNETSQERRVEL